VEGTARRAALRCAAPLRARGRCWREVDKFERGVFARERDHDSARCAKACVARGAPRAACGAMSRQQQPFIEDVEESQRIPLLLTKLKQCEQRCDFSNPRVDFVRKEIKRKALVNIIDYLNDTPGIFENTNIYGPIVRMVAANLFRALELNTAGDDLYDPEEDEARLEPAWPHLQIVYEILRKFVVAAETDPKVARKYLDQAFVLGLLDLFNSEDPREREYLKTIIHRIYGKIMSLRAFIRTSIQNTFHYYIYEHQQHNGIAEMLEILGSIINGFATPLKDDHRAFLIRSLIPLHTPKGLPTYHVQLSFCVTQFVEKEPELAYDVVMGLVRIWPITHSRKEVMFLNELEEILELTRPEEFELFIDPLFRYLARCINSSHFQVAERALFFWNNEYIVHLILHFREQVLPLVFESLQGNVQRHWNQNVVSLSHNVQKLMAEMDIELYEHYADEWAARVQMCAEFERERQRRWARVEELAARNKALSQGDGDTRSCATSSTTSVRLPLPAISAPRTVPLVSVKPPARSNMSAVPSAALGSVSSVLSGPDASLSLSSSSSTPLIPSCVPLSPDRTSSLQRSLELSHGMVSNGLKSSSSRERSDAGRNYGSGVDRRLKSQSSDAGVEESNVEIMLLSEPGEVGDSAGHVAQQFASRSSNFKEHDRNRNGRDVSKRSGTSSALAYEHATNNAQSGLRDAALATDRAVNGPSSNGPDSRRLAGHDAAPDVFRG